MIEVLVGVSGETELRLFSGNDVDLRLAHVVIFEQVERVLPQCAESLDDLFDVGIRVCVARNQGQSKLHGKTGFRELSGVLRDGRVASADVTPVKLGVEDLEVEIDLVDDLLTLSRIESGGSTLERTRLDVLRVVETVLADFSPRFEEASIEVALHADGAVFCSTDRGALEQILSNFLSNAVRYSNPGSKVDVHLAERDGQVEVSVVDTGIGIPEEDLERIFERFYRVDAARSRALGSTGLGLSIVKHLVRALDGDLHVESEPGKGSRFSFTLPSG
jgi:two-component system phosphate regulon sensor histidine kinase PhoR